MTLNIQDYERCLAEYEKALEELVKAVQYRCAQLDMDGLGVPYGRLAELYSDIVALKTLRWELTQFK